MKTGGDTHNTAAKNECANRGLDTVALVLFDACERPRLFSARDMVLRVEGDIVEHTEERLGGGYGTGKRRALRFYTESMLGSHCWGQQHNNS